MIAAVQRAETHICKDSGASRSACPINWLWTRCVQHRHCFRLMDLQLSSVGTRKCTGTRGSSGETKRIGSTMVESSVLFPVASVTSSEENETSVVFSCSGDYYLIRQPKPPPSKSEGVSHVRLQKHSGTSWLQADRRVTVDDKSSANALAGFSSVQLAPIQEGGAASSSDVAVAEPLPNSGEAGRASQEAVPIEQGQPLRAVEPDEWAMKVKATTRRSRAYTPTAASLVSSMRVWKGS